mgnify:CR=1 FL=1
MIDIHTHILSNVDDGAVNMLDSLQALQSAENAGFTDIILTPHYIPDYYENTTAMNGKSSIIRSSREGASPAESVPCGRIAKCVRELMSGT